MSRLLHGGGVRQFSANVPKIVTFTEFRIAMVRRAAHEKVEQHVGVDGGDHPPSRSAATNASTPSGRSSAPAHRSSALSMSARRSTTRPFSTSRFGSRPEHVVSELEGLSLPRHSR